MKRFAVMILLLTLFMGLSACRARVPKELPKLSPETESETETLRETETETETVTETETETETEAAVLVSEISLPYSSLIMEKGMSITPKLSIYPLDAENKNIIISSSDPAVAEVDENGTLTAKGAGSCNISFTSEGTPNVSAQLSVEVKEAPSPLYIDGTVIVNKTYALPQSYGSGSDSEAMDNFAVLKNEASKEGIILGIISGFRSYELQSSVYKNYSARDGKEAADRFSARPGHSEHQSGLAFDVNSLERSFADSTEGKWLAENCHRYGFIIRYPEICEEHTGYMYEPWHVRYVGKELAGKIKESGLCLEEYFGISSEYAE
ncbi:MAG: hypothetical protein E7638_08650 [Ruminococcaceae bacterium]|nr:hypothetical protein [Oscillospiraceae bacterium]